MCEASGNPPPVVQWSHNGILTNEGISSIISNISMLVVRTVLNISMPDLSDVGLYSCTANSSLGSTTRNIQVSVRSEF